MKLFSRLCIVLIVLSAGLLLTFLFVKTKAIDPQEHYRFHRILGRINELHAMLKQDILKLRHGFLRHYDPLTYELSELRQLYRGMQSIPKFIDAAGQAEVRKSVEKSRELLSQQEVLIEHFKSTNAVLKNSLHYFPMLATG